MAERGLRARNTLAALMAALGLLLVASGSAGTVLATPISSDPYTNPDSQHTTQVEPDSFAFGNTIVMAIQTGRFVNGGGASNLAWATSTDAGRHWRTGVLPGTTGHSGGPWARISDPAVAYDPAHDVWMISGLVFGLASSSPRGAPSAVITSRSTDGGLTWQNPVTVSLGPNSFYDKNWITCDTWAASPHYGNCYTSWDDFGQGGLLLMSTSTDGGLTWSPAITPAGSPSGLGGQPVAQPNGTLVVPYEGGAGIRSFRSIDGGASWMASVAVASVDSGSRPNEPVLDREYGPGPHGRRLHVDVLHALHGRRQSASGVRDREAADGKRVLGAGGERELRHHRSTGLGESAPRKTATARRAEDPQSPLGEERAKG